MSNEINLDKIVESATTILAQVEQLKKLNKNSIAIGVGTLQDLAFNTLALAQAVRQGGQYREAALELVGLVGLKMHDTWHQDVDACAEKIKAIAKS